MPERPRELAVAGAGTLAGALVALAVDPPGAAQEERLALVSLLLAGLGLALAARANAARGRAPRWWRSYALFCGAAALGLALPTLGAWASGLDPLGSQSGWASPGPRQAGILALALALGGACSLAAALRPQRPFLSGLLGVLLSGLSVPLLIGRLPGAPRVGADAPPLALLGALALALGLAAAAVAWSGGRPPAGPRRGALVVSGLGVVCALAASELVRAFERRRADLRVDRYTAWLRVEVEAHLATTLRRLEVFDQLLREHGPGELPTEIETSLRLEPGYAVLARLDGQGRTLWRVPAGGEAPPAAGLERALALARNGGPAVHLVLPRGAQERPQVWVAVLDPRGGYLVGLLDLRRVLRDVVEGQRERGFELALRLDGLRLLGPEPGLEVGSTWRRTSAMRLGGAAWELEVWPTPPLLGELRTGLPDAVLVVGLLLAGGFGLLFRLTQRERHSRQALEATTARLAEEVGERQRAEVALERSNRDLEEFAAVAAHDLRAPLRAVRGLTDWIAQDLGPQATGETREHLRLLGTRVERMEHLLEGLFDYARAGRQSEVAEVDVNALVGELRELLEPPPGKTIEAGPGLPTFMAARVPLLQVLLNLVGNALKHHDRAEGRVVISAREEERGYLFSVIDDGPGIPASQHRRVFQLFTTLQASDSAESVGMGLALVRRVVGRQGGRVELVSPVSEGRGTEVRFSWPRTPRRAESFEG